MTPDNAAVTLRKGTIAYAEDYREPVLILKVEKRARGLIAARYLVQRLDGSTTSNYPGYLLK